MIPLAYRLEAVWSSDVTTRDSIFVTDMVTWLACMKLWKGFLGYMAAMPTTYCRSCDCT